jgi:predicted glycosyltransferase
MKIWIDLDNTPHVPFFKPVKRELEKRGHTVTLTARDAFQVCELAEKMGLTVVKVGRHYGKNRLLKVCGLLWRSLQLLPTVLRAKPDLALSHGSRSQILLCNLLRIPTVMVMDYEFAETPWLLQPRWEIVPRVLLQAELQCKHPERVKVYEGIKEDVYAPEFKPDLTLAKQLALDPDKIIVTVRPPANEAHYHSNESDEFFVAFMNRLVAAPETQAILLPRNKAQEARLRQDFPGWFADSRVIVPRAAVDGLNLLWHSDLVVSGGGTMNREAAALGVPVYSIFRGKIGVLDRQLQQEGRLVLIERLAEVQDEIILQRRKKSPAAINGAPRPALGGIVDHVSAILQSECGK